MDIVRKTENQKCAPRGWKNCLCGPKDKKEKRRIRKPVRRSERRELRMMIQGGMYDYTADANNQA